MNVTPIKKQAQIEDYIWNEDIGAFVLSWAKRMGPGVIASSPKEGVQIYNNTPEIVINEKEAIYNKLSSIVIKNVSLNTKASTDILKMVLYRCGHTSEPLPNPESNVHKDLFFCFLHGSLARSLELDQLIIKNRPTLLL